MKNEEFYIGYLPEMPDRTARFVKRLVALLLAAAVALAALFWLGQKPFARSFFEFANEKDFEGTIRAGAVPFLIVERAENAGGLPLFERYPLVAEGKRGFEARSFDGSRVRLRGKLIQRDGRRMIEVASDSVRAVEAAASAPFEPEQPLGAFTLRGEIVDSKCFLGVMNPGERKPHRDCAVRCISGGVPPIFLVRDASGNASQLWLLSKTGEPVNREILDYVAEPVEISGEVSRAGDQLFFKIDPAGIERLK